ncbi:hypothetical protein [Kineococcus rhizosphaerae]|uniref:Uncharacterized protein n=1 Tax=Kineococcus rhizosphaerae TaxID=559628 RepID=A0A2T0QWZ4_9ACTN|nr:hypothetical protein [Kineococcus rhizosphaerae]PRY10235.1 hypothetical protein CLV37_1179 [Kineococcus rhizosphaerae]
MVEVLVELAVRFVAWYLRTVRRCWRTASRWMRPRRPGDPHVERLQAWRSWLGYASVVVAVAVSRDVSSGLAGDLVTGAVVGFALKALVAVPVFLVGTAVVALRSHRSQRRDRLTPVVRPFLLLVAVVAVPTLVLWGTEEVDDLPPGSPLVEATGPVLLGGGIALYLVWPFLLAAAAAVLVHGVRHLFCAGDVHPLLPSILAFVVALASGAENVSEAVEPSVGVEHTLALLGVGGAVTVLALTVYEHVRLRRLGWRWSDLRIPLTDLPAHHPLRRRT